MLPLKYFPRALHGMMAAALAAALAAGAQAQELQKGDKEFGVYQIQPNVYMIAGAGANIAVQTGPDGVVLVDAGRAEMSDKVIAAIKRISEQPIRYIIDTSADADHVGGNEAISRAGHSVTNSDNAGPGGSFAAGGAAIVATDNVEARMSAATGKQSPFPSGAWPTETYFTRQRQMYLNREAIVMYAEPAAHSDGDTVVFFRKSDVIAAGEVFDNTRFPVIDTEKGGSVQGEIEALNHIIELAVPSIPLVWQDGGTTVIPARGWPCDQADVVEYRDMVTIIRDNVRALIRKGMPLAQIKAADPTKGYRVRYGSDTGAWTTDMFVEAVYKSLTDKDSAASRR